MKTFFLFLMIGSVVAHAYETKQKAAACTACHGEQGVSVNTLWPNLAGQKEDYLIKQLKAFRDGARVDPLMSPVSQGLSEQDIKSLAAYFSGLKGTQ